VAMSALGLLELVSIAKGIESCDAMLKHAPVQLLLATAVCPGKYAVIIGGQVEPVQMSMERGIEIAGECIADQLILPLIHEQVIPAINSMHGIEDLDALGVVETFTMASAIKAADAAAKAAQISLIEVRLAKGLGGKGFTTFSGPVDMVEAAINAAENLIGPGGYLVRTTIIRNPHEDMLGVIL